MSDSFDTILSNNTQVSKLLSQIDQYKYNPSGIQRVILNHLTEITNGDIEVVDPTNPFVFLLEASSVNTAAFIIDNEANTRKQYPSSAQTFEDLYTHMSDKDYIDRFATPAKTKFSILISKDELLDKMVLDPLTGIRKIRIPRNSEFTVAEVKFSLQYPIDIKQLAHGGLQVVYDVTDVSPLQELSTNLIDWDIRTPAGYTDQWLYLEFDVQQFFINSITGGLTTATGFVQDITLTDQFYYARVYYKTTANNKWVEIKTTHTDQIYDPFTPTAVIQVLDSSVRVSIPQVYTNTQIISGTIRVDIYETKGNITMILENYSPNAFSSDWRSIDTADKIAESEVLSTFRGILSYSSKVVSGGKAALTFEQLRSRVIANSIGDKQLPITNVQIASALENEGYVVVKNVDNITNRIFLATKPLPKPFDEKLITAGATSIETVVISMQEAIGFEAIKNNGNRITITPDIVYSNVNGIITMLTKNELDNIRALSADKLAQKVTNNNYLFTPFHYVLDTTSAEFEVRPYYLDSPKPLSLTFINQNDSTGLQVNTSSYSISRSTTGYKLHLVTGSNDIFKAVDETNIHVLLSFIPVGEIERSYLLGQFLSLTDTGERIYEFNITSNFDIDTNDNLGITSFKMFDTSDKTVFTSLVNNFDIYYSVSAIKESTWQASVMDSVVDNFLTPDGTVGITQEKIKLQFGNSLKTLWARSRSSVLDAPYKKHTTDIALLHEEDVFVYDPITQSKFSIAPNGDVVYNYLHRKGDPVLSANGLPVYKYRAGDVVRDTNGNPIIDEVAKIVRHVDIMFIEGAYFFATDTAAVAYRKDMVNAIVEWLTSDLANLSDKLLDQTRLYFYPKTNMGLINVLVQDGSIKSIEAGQYFNVDLYVTDSVYKNLTLRAAITQKTISDLDTLLKANVISNSTIISSLKESYGSDVISLNVSGLGGNNNYSTITILEEGDRCAIRKRLVAQADGNLIVQEDVTVNFIRYEIKA
jgi:hypothetical protein